MTTVTRKQSTTTHPVPITLISGVDGKTGLCGVAGSATITIQKDGGAAAVASGALSENALSTPAGLTVTPTGTAGSTTYGYRISAYNNLGETLACAEVTTTTGNATLTGGNFNALSWTAVTGAVGYKVYGRTASAEQLLATQGGTTYSDTGAASPGGLLPAANTTSGGNYWWAGNATDRATLGDCLVSVRAPGADPVDFTLTVVTADPFTDTTASVSLNLAQTGYTPRDLSAVADASLTTADLLIAGYAGAVGDKTQSGTSFTIATAGTATTVAAKTLNSSTTPTSST